MALQTNPSRFAVLPDDVDEPIGKKSGEAKSRKKKTNANDKNGKGPGGGAPAPKAKKQKGPSLKSLAFGSVSEGKKKAQSSNINNNPPLVLTSAMNGCAKVVPNSSSYNGNTVAQWEDWQRRDHELVDEVYGTDLETALIQSKLDYQSEVASRDNGAAKSKRKKKAITVPLNEFSTMILDNKASEEPCDPHEPAEELIETCRDEAKRQLKKEKERLEEKELLSRRSAEGVYKHPHSKERLKDVEASEDAKIVEGLRIENEFLKSELESYKSRLKKVHDLFQNAQDLKDKAKLIFEINRLTKVQDDLHEEIRDLNCQLQTLYSQLEQERSKSKILEQQSRRRTNTETST